MQPILQDEANILGVIPAFVSGSFFFVCLFLSSDFSFYFLLFCLHTRRVLYDIIPCIPIISHYYIHELLYFYKCTIIFIFCLTALYNILSKYVLQYIMKNDVNAILLGFGGYYFITLLVAISCLFSDDIALAFHIDV